MSLASARARTDTHIQYTQPQKRRNDPPPNQLAIDVYTETIPIIFILKQTEK